MAAIRATENLSLHGVLLLWVLVFSGFCRRVYSNDLSQIFPAK